METIKPTELVVIFRKYRDKQGLMIYEPVKIEIGTMDPETHIFTTYQGKKVPYMLVNDCYYGFGLRTKIKKIKQNFPDITLSEYAHIYLKQLKKSKFLFSIPEIGDYQHLKFLAEKRLSHNRYYMEDADLEYGKGLLQKLQLEKLSFDAEQLIKEIKSEVIGQDSAIEDIVSILWQNSRSDKKSNILLIGPTGVGKTAIMKNITKRLNIPMATINITDFTETGYIGDSVSDALKKLLDVANNNVDEAERGIIFIDEIDKISKYNKGIDNGERAGIKTTGIQDELLKLLEAGEYEINISDDPLLPKSVTLNTANITFVCAGTFQGIKKEKGTKKIAGFIREEENNNSSTEKITSSDLVRYGFKNELAGRLPNIIELAPLNKSNLIQIMKNPKDSTIQQKIQILKDLGIQLLIEEEVYEILANDACQKNIGARGLISVVDQLFIKAMGEISKAPADYCQLIITKETVKDPHHYRLAKRKK